MHCSNFHTKKKENGPREPLTLQEHDYVTIRWPASLSAHLFAGYNADAMLPFDLYAIVGLCIFDSKLELLLETEESECRSEC